MTRVNIKIDQKTRERLRRLKREGETWDEFCIRLCEYAELVNE